MTLIPADGPEVLDAHLAFHLNAGVDLVVVSDSEAGAGAADVLDRYSQAGFVARAGGAGHSELARAAVARHAADWVIPSTTAEFWWPRGESLRDVLAVIPDRYAVVQALVREFAGSGRDGVASFEERTARTSLLDSAGSGGESPRQLLRPIYRAEPDLEIHEVDWTLGGRRVPLRAWYPIEVLRFGDAPTGSAELVTDVRLRDALRALRTAGSGGWALPIDGVSRIAFPVPSIVDDASYAIECAAVGEVDLVRLDAQIRELELRIAALEARFWPRLRSALRRLARRRR